jgi:DNA/RNA-binding domain of Phe-tRNA-synthetase-like protein
MQISPELKEKYGISVEVLHLSNLEVKPASQEFAAFKEEVFKEIREKHTLASLKDNPVVRAYRDFYWRIGIDPTKLRPASEALVRRILAGKPLPEINNLVDAYNLASALTLIPIGAYDAGKVKGELIIRTSNGESFVGIGGKELVTKGEIVLSDEEKILSIYPYRDADATKITAATRAATVVLCGVKGIERDYLRQSAEKTQEIISRFVPCDAKLHYQNLPR